MLDVKRILCPIDFSAASDHAVAHAVAVARWFGSAITAVHVYNPIFLPVPGLTLAGYRGEPTLDEAEARSLEARLRSSFAEAGVPLDVRLDIGPPQLRIVETAAEVGADLIVMGTHGASGLEHLVLGSVTEHVLRRAPCPVLTVPPRSHATSSLPFKRLLISVDFSDWSLAALELTWRLAQEADAEVTLVHAIDRGPDDEVAAANGIAPAHPLPDPDEIRQRLCGLVPDTVRQWCRPHVRVDRGRPFRVILHAAGDEHADLIVMGVHGRSPVNLALFGSTTHQVVRRATCPVLTLRR
jgi:nucleotide-binding universal stress UspA family protein